MNTTQIQTQDTLALFRVLLKNARTNIDMIDDNSPLKSYWEGKRDAYQKIFLHLQEVEN